MSVVLCCTELFLLSLAASVSFSGDEKNGKLCFGYPSADDVDVEKCWDLLERTRAGGGFFHCT